MKLLETRKICRTIGHLRLFVNLDISIGPSDVLHLKGANGSGKSTLLKTLAAGPVDSGSVSLMGRSVDQWPPWEREMWAPLVDQDPVLDLEVLGIDNLVDHLSVGASWRAWFTRSRQSVRKRLLADLGPLIEEFGLSGAMLKPTQEMSHGQRRLLTLLRALRLSPEGHPRVLLLDEPLAGLHAQKVETVLTVLQKRLNAGWAVIVAEHLRVIDRLEPTIPPLELPAIYE